MPVVVVNTPPTNTIPVPTPTTKPVEPKTGLAGDPFAEVPRPTRTVSVFRGGTKTQVVFDAPKEESGTAVTKTNNEPISE